MGCFGIIWIDGGWKAKQTKGDWGVGKLEWKKADDLLRNGYTAFLCVYEIGVIGNFLPYCSAALPVHLSSVDILSI